jgi:hypothetical protein
MDVKKMSLMCFSSMYWTDWGEDPRIERAGMDGSNRYWDQDLTGETSCWDWFVVGSFFFRPGLPAHATMCWWHGGQLML